MLYSTPNNSTFNTNSGGSNISLELLNIFKNTFLPNNYWSKNGNTVNPTDFIGTTDTNPLIFKTNNNEVFRILANKNIGIGTLTPQSKLDVGDPTSTDSNLYPLILRRGTPSPAFDGKVGILFKDLYGPIGSIAVGRVNISQDWHSDMVFRVRETGYGYNDNPEYHVNEVMRLKWNNRVIISGYNLGPGVDVGNYTLQVNGNTYLKNNVSIGTTVLTSYMLDVNGTFRVNNKVNLSGLPTSSVGLSSGDLWNDAGTIKIK